VAKLMKYWYSVPGLINEIVMAIVNMYVYFLENYYMTSSMTLDYKSYVVMFFKIPLLYLFILVLQMSVSSCGHFKACTKEIQSISTLQGNLKSYTLMNNLCTVQPVI